LASIKLLFIAEFFHQRKLKILNTFFLILTEGERKHFTKKPPKFSENVMRKNTKDKLRTSPNLIILRKNIVIKLVECMN
jgi:hypothetical protein